MKIGMVRHFPVKMGSPVRALVTQDEVAQWIDQYEATDIDEGEVDLGGIDWKRCYASDRTRAVRTAEKIFDGEIVVMNDLRELSPRPIFERNVKLPFWLWGIMLRAAFLTSHRSQSEGMADLNRRVEKFLNETLLPSGEDVLVVSHRVFMRRLRKELLQRGFKGPRFKTPANGRLYVFEN